MVKKLIIPLLVCAFSFLSCDDDDSPSGAQRIDPGSTGYIASDKNDRNNRF